MTSSLPNSGTDRVAEVAKHMTKTDIFVNLQGDEPEISAEAIDLAIDMLEADQYVNVGTIATPIRNREQLNDPSCVKVIFDTISKRAIYFSRSVIPHPRQWDDTYLSSPTFFQHVGLYAYRRRTLLQIAAMSHSRLEMVERLEQLRIVEAGMPIAVGVVDKQSFGIDTPENYLAFVERQKAV